VLESAGCEVHASEGSEISLEGDGGPTCLTAPIWRWPDQAVTDSP
jgi:arginine deiminase